MPPRTKSILVPSTMVVAKVQTRHKHHSAHGSIYCMFVRFRGVGELCISFISFRSSRPSLVPSASCFLFSAWAPGNYVLIFNSILDSLLRP